MANENTYCSKCDYLEGWEEGYKAGAKAHNTVWVLSMCYIQEGGGDVMPAKLFTTQEEAENQIKQYEKTKSDWGNVDYILDKQTVEDYGKD